MVCPWVIADVLIHPMMGNHQKFMIYSPNMRKCDGSPLIVSHYLTSAFKIYYCHLVLFMHRSMSVYKMGELIAMDNIMIIAMYADLNGGHVSTNQARHRYNSESTRIPRISSTIWRKLWSGL